jgi:hypothetical protein
MMPICAKLLMLSRTDNLATAALPFVDRDSDQDDHNQGHALMIGATDFNAKTHPGFQVSSSGCGAGGRPMC